MDRDWHRIRASLQAELQRDDCHDKRDVQTWSNLAYAHLRCGNIEQARLAAEHALELDAGAPAAWVNLGASHLQAQQIGPAEQCAQRALELAPDDASTHLFYSHVARATGQVTAAEDALLEAVRLDPAEADAWSQLALTQMDLGLPVQALNSIHKAIQLEPGRLRYHSNRLMIAQYHPELGSAELLEMARGFGRCVGEAAAPVQCPEHRQGPLRVAYLSPDFRAHPVGYLLRGVLERHDPDRVRASLWNLHAGSDWLSDEFRSLPLPWHEAGGCSDQDLAAALRREGIDVLVDLAGHTAHNRLGLLAHRPAELQLSFLGWFGAIGAPGLDAVLVGEHQLGEGCASAFAEPVESLPGTHFRYRPLPYAPTPAPQTADRPLTFGSFNNLAKLQSEVIDAWAEVLRALPEARLALRWKTLADPRVRATIQRRFEAVGVAAERLRLSGACTHEALLSDYRNIDIALDPFPFSGGMTSLEALSMGVPVITLAQLRPVSRQTHSMLTALGLGRLSTRRVQDYVTTAIELGGSASIRHRIRQQLIEAWPNSALADPGSLARHLEDAYEALLDRRGGR